MKSKHAHLLISLCTRISLPVIFSTAQPVLAESFSSTTQPVRAERATFDAASRLGQKNNEKADKLLDVEGELQDGDSVLPGNNLIFDSYEFEGEPGEEVIVRLESEEFDPQLTFSAALGEAPEVIDLTPSDNSAFSIFALPEDGSQRILVYATDPDERGRYRLTVSEVGATEQRAVEANNLLLFGISQFNESPSLDTMQPWREALSIFREEEIRAAFPVAGLMWESNTLGLIGIGHLSLSQYESAKTYFEETLVISRELGSPGIVSDLINLGAVHAAQDNYAVAISYYEQALSISRDSDSWKGANNFRQAEAYALGGLANLYSSVGQSERSIFYREQSLEIAREVSDLHSERTSLSSLGSSYIRLEEFDRAIDYFEQALEVDGKLRDTATFSSMHGEAAIKSNLGRAYSYMGEHETAISFLNQALELNRSLNIPQRVASSMGALGNVYFRQSEYDQAMSAYSEYLEIAREIGDQLGEANALGGQSSVMISLEDFSAAEATLFEAIEVYESLRVDLLDDQLISILDNQAYAYKNLEYALSAQGKVTEALAIAERGRARAFVSQLSARVSAAEQETRDSAPVVDVPEISEIQKVSSDNDITIVNYSMLPGDVLFTWVVQPTGEIEFRSLSLSDEEVELTLNADPFYRGISESAQIDELITETRSFKLVNETASNTEKLEALYQVLIDPIADLLPDEPTDKVALIPQDSLFLVPFAALIDAEGDYLIENHTIVTAPSIQVLGLAHEIAESRTPSEAENTLVVGNPTMPQIAQADDDGRLVQVQLSALPGAEAEAIAVAQLLGTQPLINGDASEALVKELLPSASIIHLATHGLLDYGKPEAFGVQDLPGAIALAPSDDEDGLLTSAEIYEMNLQAELAILSACDTGRGRITGDGVVGLSRSLITAGVPSVVVSLWAVPDAPTATLMTEFYQQLAQGEEKAQALRQAMLSIMNDDTYSDPVNWAAFSLVGEGN